MESKQPEGYPRCFVFKIVVRGGKKGTGKPRLVDVLVPAKLTRPLARYRAGMTVGFGHYHDYEYMDRAGASVQVTGFFDDGTAIVRLPNGGVSRLSKADVEVLEWPDAVDAEERAMYEAMPAHVHEMVLDTRYRNASGKDYHCEYGSGRCGMWERR